MAKSGKNGAAPLQLPKVTYARDEDFSSKYSNYVRYEATVHDFKIIFGQSDLESGQEVVRQHTSITVPWAIAKLMQYYLKVNIGVREIYEGTIKIAAQQIPPIFPDPSPEVLAQNPKAQEGADFVNSIREELIRNS